RGKAVVPEVRGQDRHALRSDRGYADRTPNDARAFRQDAGRTRAARGEAISRSRGDLAHASATAQRQGGKHALSDDGASPDAGEKRTDRGARGQRRRRIMNEHVLDVSDLPPCETLAPGDRLRVLHHREPLLLYPWLQEHGFSWDTQRGRVTEYEIVIWHTAAGDARDPAAAK